MTKDFTSRPVLSCQLCANKKLELVLFLGYLPPVNQMRAIGETPVEQPSYPAQLLRCRRCGLFQLGLVVSAKILFPPEYPYTSGTTRILRENFAELSHNCREIVALDKNDLVVDIGSNDGTLLSNFTGICKVLGIEPTDQGKLARKKGIPTITAYFTKTVAKAAAKKHGKAKMVTATNVFAHIDDPHAVVEGILSLLSPGGVFVSESHYLASLVETVQYDTIYHEHLRYYSLVALSYLLGKHGLEIVHAKRIPTHGGSIRVYAARKGRLEIRPSVASLLKEEKGLLSDDGIQRFVSRVVSSKLELLRFFADIKKDGKRVYGISAPSRASTLVNYVGLDEGQLESVLEIKGSHKIGKCMPGTLIPVEEESRLFTDPPDYALLLSWHIADELIPKLAQKGFKGGFIVPLPEPRLVRP
jgi:SAM-dependent methyltransferase